MTSTRLCGHVAVILLTCHANTDPTRDISIEALYAMLSPQLIMNMATAKSIGTYRQSNSSIYPHPHPEGGKSDRKRDTTYFQELYQNKFPSISTKSESPPQNRKYREQRHCVVDEKRQRCVSPYWMWMRHCSLSETALFQPFAHRRPWYCHRLCQGFVTIDLSLLQSLHDSNLMKGGVKSSTGSNH